MLQNKTKQTNLQEAAGVMVTALQEPRLFLLRQETGNVARDTNVKAVNDCEDELRPAGGDKAQSHDHIPQGIDA